MQNTIYCQSPDGQEYIYTLRSSEVGKKINILKRSGMLNVRVINPNK